MTKQEKNLEISLINLIKYYEHLDSIDVLCLDKMWNIIKHLPKVVRKGRYYYYPYKGKLYYLRRVKSCVPMANKAEYKRIVSDKLEPYKRDIQEISTDSNEININWQVYHLKRRRIK